VAWLGPVTSDRVLNGSRIKQEDFLGTRIQRGPDAWLYSEESPPASLLMLCRLAGSVAQGLLIIILVFLMHK